MDRETIKALIQKYKQQVESLNLVIRHLEAELGEPQAVAGTTDNGATAVTPAAAKRKAVTAVDPLSLVREWHFYNKAQPEAAEELLELVGHPLSIGVLVDGLEKGGAKIGGKTAAEKRQNLATVLARSGKFGRAGRGTWGLPNWPHITPVKRAEENGGEAELEKGAVKTETAKPAGE